jgi:hypothetical protein
MAAGRGGYEVILTRKVKLFIRVLDPEEKQQLGLALGAALVDTSGPYTVVVQRPDLPPGHTYLVCLLAGFLVVYRRATDSELDQVASERKVRLWRRRLLRGFVVMDIVSILDMVPALP